MQSKENEKHRFNDSVEILTVLIILCEKGQNESKKREQVVDKNARADKINVRGDALRKKRDKQNNRYGTCKTRGY